MTEAEQREIDAARALREQSDDEDMQDLPSSMCRKRGLVWIEGWFDLPAALALALERVAALETALTGICNMTAYVENSYAREAYKCARAALNEQEPRS
jgi:hypothetical protein